MKIEKEANKLTLFLLIVVSIVSLAIIRIAELKKEERRNGIKIKKEVPIKYAIDSNKIASIK